MADKKTAEPSEFELNAFKLMTEINRFSIEAALRAHPVGAAANEVITSAGKYADFIIGKTKETEDTTDGE